jgi:hypothetical protein
MKVTQKLLMVNVEFPIQVGDLKCNIQVHVCRDLDKEEKEDGIDFVDIDEITYRGIPIEGYDSWKKFKKFHLEMGINWDEIIFQEIEKMKVDIIEEVNVSY